MRLRLPALAAGLFLVAAMPAAVGAQSGHQAQSDHDRIVAYWTPARIAAARPRDYIRDDKGHLVPYAKPGGSGGAAVTGASWTQGGAIETRSGRILFSDSTGDWICSGSVLNDGSTTDGYSLVLSAGHCAYDSAGGYAFNWMYIPDFDAAPTYTCASAKYGCWTARELVLSSAFVNGGGFGDATVGYDWSIAIVGAGGNSNSQLDALGSYSLKTTGNTVGATAWAFGYPAAGKYHGNDLTYCKGTTVNDPYGAPTWGVGCDMTGGSSGGPWLVTSSSVTATDVKNGASGATSVGSLNSYGYSGLRYMFGPKFNSDTQAVYNRANADSPGPATNGVPVHATVP